MDGSEARTAKRRVTLAIAWTTILSREICVGGTRIHARVVSHDLVRTTHAQVVSWARATPFTLGIAGLADSVPVTRILVEGAPVGTLCAVGEDFGVVHARDAVVWGRAPAAIALRVTRMTHIRVSHSIFPKKRAIFDAHATIFEILARGAR